MVVLLLGKQAARVRLPLWAPMRVKMKMTKPEGYDEMVRRNQEAMDKHWEDFKKSGDYGVKPYYPLFISPGLVGVEFEDDEKSETV